MLFRTLILLILSISFLCSNQTNTNEEEIKIGVYENLNKTIPLDLKFVDEYGNKKTLKEFINKKPTILTLNYFSCTSLCSPLLAGVSEVLDKMQLKPYIDYNVLTISIEPLDTPELALSAKKSHLNSIQRPFPPQTWSFLTGSQKNIDAISDAVGFKYQKRQRDSVVDYLHPGVIIVISPNGKIARYLNGVRFLPFDLKLAVLEASEERSGPTIANTLLYCFAYDAKSKTYVFQAEKIFGSFMFGGLLIFFIYLIKTGRKRGEE